ILECLYIRKKLNLDFNIFSLDKNKYLFLSLIFIPVTNLINHFANNLFVISILSIIINVTLYFGVLLIIKDKPFMELFNKFISKLKI
ncbi:MAG: flippase, partial [Clostridium perfringens]